MLLIRKHVIFEDSISAITSNVTKATPQMIVISNGGS